MGKEGYFTCHKLNDVLVRFHEDQLDTLGIACLQLLLKVATPVLILAKSVYFPLVAFNLGVIEAGVVCQG